MKTVLFVCLILIFAGALFFRLAPSQPRRWHIDPLTAPDPDKGHARISAGPEATTYPRTPKALLRDFDAVAMAAPRTERLAGSVEEGRITYICRSLLFGFPDYISVTAVPVTGGAQLAVLSRQRFGSRDMGVNRKRLDGWLQRLQALM